MKKLLLAVVALLAIQSFKVDVALAQPDINNATKSENPPNWKWNPKPPRTPTTELMAQRRAKRIEARVSEIRPQLKKAGFTDEALQTTIVDYYKSEQEARAKVSERYQKINVSIRYKKTPDDQMADLLSDLRAAVKEEKARQQKSFAQFSAKLKLDENPRLDALLMILGIVGDERAFASQASGTDYIVNTLAAANDVAVKAN